MPRKIVRRKRPRAGALAGVSKKDFVAVAEIFCRHQVPESAARDLASYFKGQNPQFNVDRFIAATRSC